jgi:DNA-binding CsgD family transcriptional regulator
VAELLGLSVHTVRGHMKGIFSKLGVQSQVALLGKLAGHAVPTARKR